MKYKLSRKEQTSNLSCTHNRLIRLSIENQLEQSRQLQEQQLSNILHELKTPLTVIFSAAQLLESYLNNNQLSENQNKIAGGIQSIKHNCDRMTRLIGNIVDCARLEAGFVQLKLSDVEIVNASENIVHSISEYASEMGLHLIFDTDIEEKWMACDLDKLERVLLNLISNAIKFSEKEKEIFIELQDMGEEVQISVRDQGIGIEPDQLARIFDRYQQAGCNREGNASNRDRGSGIGLSLVKSIIELHGGRISVESIPSVGSVFRFVLPARVCKDIEAAK